MFKANTCSYCAVRFEEGEKRQQLNGLDYHPPCAEKRSAEPEAVSEEEVPVMVKRRQQ